MKDRESKKRIFEAMHKEDLITLLINETTKNHNYRSSIDTILRNAKQEKKKYEEEIKELELIIGLRQKRALIKRFDDEYNEEDKKKNPNRTYAGVLPDAEVVYQRYYKQKEVLNKLRDTFDKLYTCGKEYSWDTYELKDYADEMIEIFNESLTNEIWNNMVLFMVQI